MNSQEGFSLDVSDLLGYHNKVPHTGGLNNSFSHRSPGARHWQLLLSGETSLFDLLSVTFSMYPRMASPLGLCLQEE